MREIQTHKVNEANSQLTIQALDGPGPGGADHAYLVSNIEFSRNPSAELAAHAHAASAGGGCLFVFQNGAVKEAGVNGITHEVLLAILIDRLSAFQNGPYACKENAEALHHLQVASTWLAKRTNRRVEQGVEGTMALDPEPAPVEQPKTPKKALSGNPIMRYFTYGHLPVGPLRDTSELVGNLAQHLEETIPGNAEKSHGMRKLLEAKDCFVRAVLPPL